MQAENKYYTVTPLYKSPLLSKQFNVEVNYKMECYQPSGSFKVRGMDALLKNSPTKDSKK